MKVRVLKWWESLRTSYWFLPALMCATSIGLAYWTSAIDARLPDKAHRQFGFLWTGSAEGARAVLSTIASSMITVAGVTFSITIVALVQASSQFGPRLLRTFMRDVGNQVVLGTFVGTYVYCLLVLRTVHATQSNTFIPQFSIGCALGMAVASLAVLIYFIHHVCDSIQAENVVASVGREMLQSIRKFPIRSRGSAVPELNPETLEWRRTVSGCQSGYLQAIDLDGLAKIAKAHDAVFDLIRHAGDFVATGANILRSTRELDEPTERKVQAAFIVGRRRTPTQDLDHQVHQLVEIAVRALSPSINDPFTAMACIDWLGAVLLQAMERELPSGFVRDHEGAIRIHMKPAAFSQMCGAAFHQIRQNGAGHLSVTLRLIGTYTRLAEKAPSAEDLSILAAHAEETREEGMAENTTAADRSALEKEFATFCDARRQRELALTKKPLHAEA